MTIDPESEAFIQWVSEILQDPVFYHEFLKESIRKLANFYSHDPVEIKQKLAVKLLLGAKEHGEPIYTPEQTDRELENEFIDIIGWRLVREWNTRKDSRDSS